MKKKLKEEPDGAYVMVCSDVKDFKIINDVFGMQSGDELLIRIAERLREKHMREQSTEDLTVTILLL